MLVFEGNSTNLTLHQIEQYFGKRDWGNNTYQIEVWKTIFTQPIEFLISVFKGGAAYLVYIFAYLFNLNQYIPSILENKYTDFKTVVLVKTLFIYAFPFLMYLITRLIIMKIQIRNTKK
jgi:hypothetical protein